jgi:dihydrofolate reductase
MTLFAGRKRRPGLVTFSSTGGADVARQFLSTGTLDEIRLHLVPVVLGGGTRLFDETVPGIRLVPASATNTPLVTHLTYEVPQVAADGS